MVTLAIFTRIYSCRKSLTNIRFSSLPTTANKKQALSAFFLLVDRGGIEPPVFAMRMRRFTN